ncbi:MAG TPA: protein-disulfide reductase DsbD family protein [Candidatus Omnitrophota bacterium]|mgnify:CR=1 FL=1|nr:protein-disulfide reductase DsbD family protein [Candidatus Omnitrophota bacterium]
MATSIGRFLSILFFTIWLSVPVSAEPVYDAHARVELIADTAEITPGSEFQAGVLFRMDPEWHVYWKNPGDSGLAPVFKWELPEGISAGEIRWPIPQKIDLPPLTSYGYEKEVLLAVPFKASPELNTQLPAVLRVKVEWLACKVECIPGKAELEIKTPFQANNEIFRKTESTYPAKKLPWKVEARRTEKNIQLSFFSGEAKMSLGDVYFFPENEALVSHAEPQTLTRKNQGYELQIPLSVNHPEDLESLRGVLVSREGLSAVRGWEVNVPFSSAAPAVVRPPLHLAGAVFFAFLGGLILNLMPCVLPVLSLKILSFVSEANQSRPSVLKQGLIFTAGVLFSFWVLAGALILLKAGGQQIGWGFQLQSPWFVAVLAVIFLILAFNLFGFFEIGLSLTGAGQNLSAKKGWAGTFASGVLAVVVATPCTAPFMGTALGYALTQPAWTAWIIFTALGFGLAFPYFILCANPAWLRFIPKPGPWMITLKRVLGTLLLLTVFWLGWIFSVQMGAFQIVSRNQEASAHKLSWEPYSEARLTELLAAGRPIFVDFTAAWCLTCQVNERLVLDRKETAELFKEGNIAALKADWTNRDEEVTRALASHGRNSIPFYLFYSGKGAAPVVLPEILTPKIVREALSVLDLQKEAN